MLHTTSAINRPSCPLVDISADANQFGLSIAGSDLFSSKFRQLSIYLPSVLVKPASYKSNSEYISTERGEYRTHFCFDLVAYEVSNGLTKHAKRAGKTS